MDNRWGSLFGKHFLNEGNNLIAHGQTGIRLVTHIEFIVVETIGTIFTFGDADAQDAYFLALQRVELHDQRWGTALVQRGADLFFYLLGIRQTFGFIFAWAGTDKDRTAGRVSKGDNVTHNRGQFATPLAGRFVEALENRGAFFKRCGQGIKGFILGAGWAGAIKVRAAQQGFDVLEGGRFQVQFSRTFTNPQPLRIFRISGQPMGITALDTVHPAWILGLAAIKETGG